MLLRVSLTRKTSGIPLFKCACTYCYSALRYRAMPFGWAIFSLLVLNSIASSEVRDNHLEKATRLRLKLLTLKSSSLGYDL
jgi:hypothetical protein